MIGPWKDTLSAEDHPICFHDTTRIYMFIGKPAFWKACFLSDRKKMSKVTDLYFFAAANQNVGIYRSRR